MSEGILVFGKRGQLATALARRGSIGGHEIVCAGRDDADLSVPGGCAAHIARIRPALVINAAAYTAVDKAEGDAALANRINGAAPGEMAAACAGLSIPFIHVSTDYVFDGSGTRAWREDDTIAPLGVYGASKAAGEAAVRESSARAVILRVSWVFSDTGANFVKTMLRLGNERDALSIVDDQRGGPTPASALAEAIDTISNRLLQNSAQPGGTYHLASQPVCSWCEFAQSIFDEAVPRGLTKMPTVTPIASDQFPTPAQRPANSALDGTKLQTEFGIGAVSWREGLRDCLDRLAKSMNEGDGS